MMSHHFTIQRVKLKCRLVKSMAVIFFLLVSTIGRAQMDTLCLYAGGPSYLLSHDYTTYQLPDCGIQLTDAAYDGAAYNVHMNGKKKGDTYVWQTLKGESYRFVSKEMTTRNGNQNTDTLTTEKEVTAEVQLVKTTISQNVEIYVFAEETTTPRNWILISCKSHKDTSETVVKKYRVIVEQRPKAVASQIKVCNFGYPLILSTYVDKSGGTFSIAKKGQPFASAQSLFAATFAPTNYSIGNYTVFYQKKYANDTIQSLATNFNVEVFSLPIALKATPNEIRQGEHVAFEPFVNLPKNDSLLTAEWDYGDRTPLSKQVKPYHYYLDTGAMTVSLKLTTQNGCRQSVTQKAAVYVNPIPFEVTTDSKGPAIASYYGTTENDTRFYPNPSTGLFHFTAYNPLEAVHVVVHRVNDGVIVFEGQYKEIKTMDLDLEWHGAGMFLCVFKYLGGNETRFKLIKQ